MYHLFFSVRKKNLRFTFVILRTIQVDKYWITYCGLSLVDMNYSVLTSVSVDMLIIAELFVKKRYSKTELFMKQTILMFTVQVD